MGEFHCDRCNGGLLVKEDVRYKLRIEVASVYDPMELHPRNDPGDIESELQAIVRSLEGRSAEELEAEVYKRFEFDLCLSCQRAFIANPLGHKEAENESGGATGGA